MLSFVLTGAVGEKVPALGDLSVDRLLAALREPLTLDAAKAEWIAKQLLEAGEHGILLPVNIVLDAYVRGKSRCQPYDCSQDVHNPLRLFHKHALLFLQIWQYDAVASRQQIDVILVEILPWICKVLPPKACPADDDCGCGGMRGRAPGEARPQTHD